MEKVYPYNYKEPLKEIPKKEGFGYYGTISLTEGKDKIQCHVCGKLFRDAGVHIWQKHMPVAKYREKYDLAYTTALISETERERRKNIFIDYWNGLTKKEKEDIRERSIKGGRLGRKFRGRGHPKIRLETKNKRGTCPDQLIQKIKEVAEKLKKTPSLRQFVKETGTQKYKHLIFINFGSWQKAVTLAGLQPNPKIKAYTNEELLDYLKSYHARFGTAPTRSDCDRGLVPAIHTYIRHFGSFGKAKQLAGIEK